MVSEFFQKWSSVNKSLPLFCVSLSQTTFVQNILSKLKKINRTDKYYDETFEWLTLYIPLFAIFSTCDRERERERLRSFFITYKIAGCAQHAEVFFFFSFPRVVTSICIGQVLGKETGIFVIVG